MPTEHHSRLLRITIFRDRNQISERLIPSETTVAIDPSPQKTCSHCGMADYIVLTSEGIPATAIILFGIDATNHYFLNIINDIEGSVRDMDSNRLHRLSELRTECERNGTEHRFPLHEGHRGRIELGELTILFQFVLPPSSSSRRPAFGHPARNGLRGMRDAE